MRLAYRLILLSLLGVAGLPLAYANENLGEYGAWGLYRYADSAGDTCTLSTTPTKSRGKYSRRGAVYFHITTRAERGWKHDISISMGYPIKVGSEVSVRIDGGQNYNFYSEGEHAFLNEKQTDRLLGRLRAGNRMRAKGTSERGTATTDDFSLSGVTKGLKAMKEKCG